MIKLTVLMGALACLGCSAPPQAQSGASQGAGVVMATAIEAVRPGGPHPVGVAEGPALASGATTRLYYPAADASGEVRAEGPSPDHRADLARRFGPDAAGILAQAVTAARRGAAPATGRFPLVVFQPGASMGGGDYRLLIEDVASRGYVVLVLNPEGSPPVSGGRYRQAAAELVEAVALARSGAVAGIEGDRVAVIGHSLGGAAAVMALADLPGAVAVNLDGDYNGPTRIPADGRVLYLLGRTEGEADRSRDRRARVWREAAQGASDAVALQVPDVRHFDFADAALIQDAVPEDRRRTRFGAIGGAKAHALTTDLVAGFLDSRLKGQADAWSAARARHPEAAAPTTW